MERLWSLHDGDGLSWRKIASMDEFRGLSPAELWRIAQGHGIGRKAARVLGLPPRRTRIAADVTAEQRDMLHEMAAAYGMSWSELCRRLAEGGMTVMIQE